MKIKDAVLISTLFIPLGLHAETKHLFTNDGKMPVSATEATLYQYTNAHGESVIIVTDKEDGRELLRIVDGKIIYNRN